MEDDAVVIPRSYKVKELRRTPMGPVRLHEDVDDLRRAFFAAGVGARSGHVAPHRETVRVPRHHDECLAVFVPRSYGDVMPLAVDDVTKYYYILR